VPEFGRIRQKVERDCGAAALAMVLQRWSVPSSLAEILRAIPSESGHGIASDGTGFLDPLCFWGILPVTT
jgi:ABC-type bacteriocin/lantibiotic exporter with double-glycine peptidase domain